MGLAKSNSENFTVGAGSLFFDQIDDDGNYTGYRHLGDSESMSITASPEELEVWFGSGPVAEKALHTTTSISRSASTVLQEMTPENWGLFLIGHTEDLAQTAETGQSYVIATAEQGRFYKIGETDANPVGVFDLSSVTVTDGAAVTYDINTDYTLDLARGFIFIVDGGDIDGTSITVNFDQAAGTRTTVKSHDRQVPRGRLRYVEDPTEGKARSILMGDVRVTPDGDMSVMSREENQKIPLSIHILRRGDAPAVIVYEEDAA